jgi:ATP-dependent helicase HepA
MFKIGDPVFLKADKSRKGIVIQVLGGAQSRYQVFHSPNDVGEYGEAQLASDAPIVSAHEALLTALMDQVWIGAEEFRARLTAQQIAHPLSSSLYALHAARISYIPFQFKPLLRFLQSDRPRLLIADEVGVGKTIEAGLILKELQSRQRADRVLIVCPKALVGKWRAEMRRFDEDFQILTPEQLEYCINETDLDGEWPSQYNRAIVNLEALRMDIYLQGRANRRGLLNLDAPPQFDLLILDEAHHVRNSETSSHAVLRFLCDVSEAVVFLSATPIQTSSQNLYSLLNLLRDDLFQDFGLFELMAEPNEALNRAARLIRNYQSVPNWQVEVLDCLIAASDTSWGRNALSADANFTFWLDRLNSTEMLSDSERIRCLRDLEEVHAFVRVVSRTRRRDVGRFTIREPHTVAVPFTPQQRDFYEQLIDFRRRVLTELYGSATARLIIDTLERQATSCLPMIAQSLANLAAEGHLNLFNLTDVDDEEGNLVLQDELRDDLRTLQRLAAALPLDDPKFDQLVQVIQSVQEGLGSRKLLVFSFFLNTLHYLYERLTENGYRVGLITGRTLDVDRETLRSRFALAAENSNAFDILLSSEVGCEGLDYQFCDRLVNYDIPWNPMRIEQRIGRIDRYGQRSDKVLIYNFVTPGTVEERIYFRCFDRLGIFSDTLGDLEEVLGEVMTTLDQTSLNIQLSRDQSERVATQTADNALRRVEEQRRLEDDALLASDLVPQEGDVEQLRREGRYIASEDLHELLSLYLQQDHISGRLIQDSQSPVIFRLRVAKDGRAGILDRLNSLGLRDRQTKTLRQWLEKEGSEVLPLTFDQATAVDQRQLEFITPVHPLIRLAVSDFQSSSVSLTTSLVLKADHSGDYLAILELWESIAVRPEVRIAYFAWNLETLEPAPAHIVESMPNLLRASKSYLRDIPASMLLHQVMETANKSIIQEHSRAVASLKESNATLIDRRLANLDAYYSRRLERIENDITNVTDERIRRMRRSERDRVTLERDRRIAQLEQRREADITTKRIAMFFLKVDEGND